MSALVTADIPTLVGEPPTDRWHNPHRPYARQRGTASVTTIIGQVTGAGLAWGAAKETALFAVHHRDEWEHLDDDAAVERLRRHHRGVWDSKAAMGTLIHSVLESWTYGTAFDLEEAIAAAAPKAPLWQGREHEVLIEALGYVAGLRWFIETYEPEIVATEEVIRGETPEGVRYVGQRDLVARIGDDLWLLDLKTTSEQDRSKGAYPASWSLQLAAYRHATEIERYDDDCNLVATLPAYPIARCGIVHLRGTEPYEPLLEVSAGADEYRVFCALALHNEWAKGARTVPVVPGREGR